MSGDLENVKRYDCGNGGGLGGHCYGCYTMEEVPEYGDWVRYEDYERVANEVYRLRAENAQLQERCDVLSQNWPSDHEQPD